MIIRGRNVYPLDIELTAEAAHTALSPRCTVAFTVERDGKERLIVVAEVLRERRSRLRIDEVGESVHRAVAAEHGVAVAELVLVQPASTLKTSSGKLQRSATRKAYAEGTLDTLAVWRNPIHDEELVSAPYEEAGEPAISELQAWLAAVISAKLNTAPAKLDPDTPIAEYGLDSLAGVELIAEIEEKLGIELPFECLFVGEPSLARLAAIVSERLAANPAKSAPEHEPLPSELACGIPIHLRVTPEQEANP
jgi:acyl carrier protein